MPVILAKKLGMTRVYDGGGSAIPVTVLEAGPCTITAIRESERDGYDAVQLSFGVTEERKLTKPEMGHLRKAGSPPSKTLVEFRNPTLPGDERKIGDRVTVADFEPGQRVRVSGVSIGKGFQGTVKRHNFSRGPVSHGSHNVRAPGSIGASADPARVFKGMRMPGQMGARRVTQRGAEVVEVDADRNLLLLRGSVPGARNGTLEVRADG